MKPEKHHRKSALDHLEDTPFDSSDAFLKQENIKFIFITPLVTERIDQKVYSDQEYRMLEKQKFAILKIKEAKEAFNALSHEELSLDVMKDAKDLVGIILSEGAITKKGWLLTDSLPPTMAEARRKEAAERQRKQAAKIKASPEAAKADRARRSARQKERRSERRITAPKP